MNEKQVKDAASAAKEAPVVVVGPREAGGILPSRSSYKLMEARALRAELETGALQNRLITLQSEIRNLTDILIKSRGEYGDLRAALELERAKVKELLASGATFKPFTVGGIEVHPDTDIIAFGWW
jgi:hypothetical protein